MTEPTAHYATGYIPVSEDLMADAPNLADSLADRLSNPRPQQPPPEGPPAPPPGYLQLVAAAAASPVLAEIVALHHPEPYLIREDGTVPWWTCAGDEYSGYDGEPPDWPCETVGIVAQHLDVTL